MFVVPGEPGLLCNAFLDLFMSPLFAPERDAIKADAQLQSSIISCFEATELGIINRGSNDEAPRHKFAPSDFNILCNISELWQSQLLVDTLTGCAYGQLGSVLKTATASLDHIDRLLPKLPESAQSRGQARRQWSLIAVGHLVDIAFGVGDIPRPPQLTVSLLALRAVRWEAGILMKLLQSNAADSAGQAAESLHNLLVTLLKTCLGPDGNIKMGADEFHALPGELITELVRASDFLARVAAKTLAPEPTIRTGAATPELLLERIEMSVVLFLDRAYSGLPSGEPVSSAELDAALGLIGTAVKATLHLAGEGERTAPDADRINFLRLQLIYSGGVVSRILSAMLAGAEDRGSPVPLDALK